ncbi:MAG: sensor histidine kinase, partial [Pseudomonadota bacterium]
MQRLILIAGFLGAVGLLAVGVWSYGYRQALDSLSLQAEGDLELAAERLSAELQRYQETAVLMADHPILAELNDPARLAMAQDILLDVADKTSALDVFYVDGTGRVLVSAHGAGASSVAGEGYFQRAMQGALGSAHGLFRPSGLRAYYYAAPDFGPDGKVRGALVVVADIAGVEWDWRGSTPAVLFTDNRGEVFISNRSELLFWRRPEPGAGLIPPEGDPKPFRESRVGRHEIWQVGWGPYLPRSALHLTQDLPVIDMTGEVLVSVAPSQRLALLQAAAVAAICLAFGAMLFLATERRRTLAQANAVLESRVAERTRAVTATNTQLRREIAERQDAEAALKRAQADLVQAGKLSALGQMSAGISHELNQPL